MTQGIVKKNKEVYYDETRDRGMIMLAKAMIITKTVILVKAKEEACTVSLMINEDYGYGKDYYCGKDNSEVIAKDKQDSGICPFQDHFVLKGFLLCAVLGFMEM